jgi:uncharacterized RDD family membrane protein YckC
MSDHPEMEYVGFGLRVGASLIDTLFLFAMTWPLLTWIYGWAYFGSEKLIAGPADLLLSWVFPAACIMFWIYKRAAPGKMAISAVVVDATTGDALTTGQAIGRYLGYFVSTIPLGLGLIWVGMDPRKQGWHDKLANTVVIRPRNRGPQPVRFER